MSGADTNIRNIMREHDMKGFQWVAVVLCVFMTGIDGYDALAVSFAGPILSMSEPSGWMLDRALIGLLGSAALAGMVGGSLLLSPLADFAGRRGVALLCLTIVTIGMIASAFAQDYNQLLILRVFTGVGIGAMFAPVNAITAEYSSLKRREMAISLMVIGYPLGAVIGGWIAIPMSNELLGVGYGWQSIFLLGGIATGALIPLVYFFMPESMDFLLTRRPKGALKKINVLLRKLGHEELTELPPPDAEAQAAGGLQEMGKQPYFGRTIMIVTGYFMTIGAFYFVQYLTANTMSDVFGYPLAIAQSASIWLSIGGIVGGLAFGALSFRLGRSQMTASLVVLAVGAVALFGWLLVNTAAGDAIARWQAGVDGVSGTGLFGWLENTVVGLYLALSSMMLIIILGLFAMGFTINGAIAGFYASMAAAYPTHLRAAGTGWGLGVGRLGAVLAPPVGGLLLAQGVPESTVYALVGVPMLLAAVAIWFTDNRWLQVIIALVYGAFLLFVTSAVGAPEGPERSLFLGLLWFLRLIGVMMIGASILLLTSALRSRAVPAAAAEAPQGSE